MTTIDLYSKKTYNFTYADILNLFNYNDGNLYYKYHRYNNRIGTTPYEEVRCSASIHGGGGYVRTYFTINKTKFRLFKHRLIYFYHHGYFPNSQIDHRDADKENNKIENLQPISQSNNINKRGLIASNSTGVTGIVRCSNGWTANITIVDSITKKRKHTSKSYKTFNDAVCGRYQLELKYHFPMPTSAYNYIKEHIDPDL